MPNTAIEDLVQVRPALPGDMSFIYMTWLDALREADASPLPDDIFFPAHREYLNRVLSSPQVSVLILCPTAEPNRIYGYVVAEPGVLHWLFLRPKFRGLHLAPLLLSSAQAQSSSLTWRTKTSRKLRLKFNPRAPRHQHACTSTASQSPDSK